MVKVTLASITQGESDKAYLDMTRGEVQLDINRAHSGGTCMREAYKSADKTGLIMINLTQVVWIE